MAKKNDGRTTFVWLAALFCLLVTLAPGTLLRVCAEEADDGGSLDLAADEPSSGRILSAYEGTPLPVVQKMLELANVQPDEAVYDLGSGDGRIVIMAAQKFGARGVGIELDPLRCEQAIRKVQDQSLMHQVRIIEGDVLEADLSGADVITIYMPPYGLRKLKPRLEESLRGGTRIVVSQHEIPGWEPAETVTVPGGNKKSYKLTLYEISRSGGWTYYSDFGQRN